MTITIANTPNCSLVERMKDKCADSMLAFVVRKHRARRALGDAFTRLFFRLSSLSLAMPLPSGLSARMSRSQSTG